MKSKILLRHFFVTIFLILVALFSKAQVIWDTLPYKQYADFKLQNLDKSIITTGILYDRMMPIADIERFKQQDQFTDTTGQDTGCRLITNCIIRLTIIQVGFHPMLCRQSWIRMLM